jgi:hypothetical protein
MLFNDLFNKKINRQMTKKAIKEIKIFTNLSLNHCLESLLLNKIYI